jgi:hypothetical protein
MTVGELKVLLEEIPNYYYVLVDPLYTGYPRDLLRSDVDPDPAKKEVCIACRG